MHYYKILRHNAGFGEGTNYWEKLLARYLAATGGGKILTTLPITFTSTSWKLASWTIYGNDEPGKNLVTTEAHYTYDGLTIDVVDSVAKIQGTFHYSGSLGVAVPFDIPTVGAGGYTLSGASNYSETHIRLGVIDPNETVIGYDEGDGFTFYIRTPPKEYKVLVAFDGSLDGVTIDTEIPIMVREYQTSPEFEPGQVGVGEKTKNVIQLGESQSRRGITVTIDSLAGTAILDGDTTEETSGFSVTLFDSSSLASGDYIFSGGADGGSSTTYDLYLYNRTDQEYMGRLYNSTSTLEVTLESGKRYVVYVQIRRGRTFNDIVFKPMLRKADTTSEFIPYGYQVPLDIRHKTKNRYDVTGVDITRYGNIVKEEDGKIRITGTSSYDANHIVNIARPGESAGDTNFQIDPGAYILTGAVENTNSNYRLQVLEIVDGTEVPLGYDSGEGLELTFDEPSIIRIRIYVKKAAYDIPVDLTFFPMLRPAGTSPEFEPYYLFNHEDIFIGDSPLTEGQSISNTEEIEVFEGENTIDTTLYNKPEMEITYE